MQEWTAAGVLKQQRGIVTSASRASAALPTQFLPPPAEGRSFGDLASRACLLEAMKISLAEVSVRSSGSGSKVHKGSAHWYHMLYRWS